MRIEFNDVSISHTLPNGVRRVVLDDLSLAVHRGERVYLVGPTGSGKSTLLRALYMDIFPERGVATVGSYRSDTVMPQDIPFLRRSLGVIFQDFQLLEDRSAYDNVAFALFATGKRGAVVKARTLQALSRVGLAHKAKSLPHELSGGEQQRVAIARAIVNEPWILLADEPTGNLDPTVAEEILKLLIALHHGGMTLIMATHDYRLVRKYPARTLAFLGTRLVEIDPETLE